LLRDDGGQVWQRSVGPWSVGRELRRRSRPQRWEPVFCSAVRPRNPNGLLPTTRRERPQWGHPRADRPGSRSRLVGGQSLRPLSAGRTSTATPSAVTRAGWRCCAVGLARAPRAAGECGRGRG